MNRFEKPPDCIKIEYLQQPRPRYTIYLIEKDYTINKSEWNLLLLNTNPMHEKHLDKIPQEEKTSQ